MGCVLLYLQSKSSLRTSTACSAVAPPLSAALLVSQAKKVLSAPSPPTPSDTAVTYLTVRPSLATSESATSTVKPCYRCRTPPSAARRTRPYWRYYASDENRSLQPAHQRPLRARRPASDCNRSSQSSE